MNTENAEGTEILYLNVEVAKHSSFTTPLALCAAVPIPSPNWRFGNIASILNPARNCKRVYLFNDKMTDSFASFIVELF